MTDRRPIKKVIIFGSTFWMDDVEKMLKRDANVSEVIKVLSLGTGKDLISVIKQHKKTDAIIICGKVIRNQIHLIIGVARTLTRAPIILLMPMEMSFRKMNEYKRAGATQVLAEEVITYRELVEVFVKMMSTRPHLRLVKSERKTAGS